MSTNSPETDAPDAAPTEFLAERVAELQTLVSEKDELLSALTARLEQAAEQLDRMRREGPAYALAQQVSPRTLPGYGVEEPDWAPDLRQMLQEWQNLQVDGWFGRQDLQMADLRELLLNRSVNTSAAEHEPRNHESPAVHAPRAVETSHTNLDQSWEATKAALLGTPLPESPPTTVTIDDELVSSDLLVLSEPPGIVDFETADTQGLQNAILERDEYIIQLLDHVHALEAEFQPTQEVPSLPELSEEQEAELTAWLSAEQQALRKAQVALSIERAHLSRDQMHLRHEAELLQRQLKQLSLDQRTEDIGQSLNGASKSGQPRRRWMRIFGN